MPYIETNNNCISCICSHCDLFHTDNCLEGKNSCNYCNNKTYTSYCPWSNEENKCEFINIQKGIY